MILFCGNTLTTWERCDVTSFPGYIQVYQTKENGNRLEQITWLQEGWDLCNDMETGSSQLLKRLLGFCYWTQALADRRLPSHDPRKHCGTNFFRLQFPSVANWNSAFGESDNFSVSHKVDSGKISVQTFLLRLQTQPISSQLCVNSTETIAAMNIHLVFWL